MIHAHAHAHAQLCLSACLSVCLCPCFLRIWLSWQFLVSDERSTQGGATTSVLPGNVPFRGRANAIPMILLSCLAIRCRQRVLSVLEHLIIPITVVW
jgi:hypothetical protein